MKEDGLLDRILKMSVGVTVFVTLYVASLGRAWEGLSFAIGAAVSIGFFLALRAGIEHGFRPGAGRKARVVTVIGAVVKYGLAGWLIALMVRWPHARMGFFLAGATTVPAVIVLKALGQLLAEASAKKR
ncbi:MAG TPA: hypothetical protein VGM51_19150 [Armatimonadota bacterium]|jgi:hypothetical protein